MCVCVTVFITSHGQLGHSGLTPEKEPRPVEALWGVRIHAVSTGGWHSACVSGESLRVQRFEADCQSPAPVDTLHSDQGACYRRYVTGREGGLFITSSLKICLFVCFYLRNITPSKAILFCCGRSHLDCKPLIAFQPTL